MTPEMPNLLPDRIRLGDILPILRRSWGLVLLATLLCTLGAGLVVVLSTREYRATAVIRIVPSQGQEIQSREVLDMDMRGFQEVERFYRTQVQLFKSKSFADRVVAAYTAQSGVDLKPAAFLSYLEVLPIERSQLVEVSFTAPDPQQAADIANIAAQTFVAENIEWRRTMAREANRWVEEQLAEVEARRAAVVQQSLAFKGEHDIVDIEGNGGALNARMQALEDSYGKVSTERVLLESRLAGHERLLASGDMESLASPGELPLSPRLVEFYIQAKADLVTASAKYGPLHPEYQRADAALKRARGELERAVVESVRGERARLELLRSQEQRLVAERSDTTDQVLKREGLEAEYREIKRLLGQIEETHKSLLKRRDELDLSAETKLNNAHLVDQAKAPMSFVRPRVTLTILAGLALGLVLGVSVALARGYLDENITSPKDVESYVPLRLLGVLPHVDRVDGVQIELVPHVTPRSRLAEALRGVRTVVESHPDGTRITRLLVTSSVGSEGKTCVAVQLATVFAQQGRRTLLVEGDHRKPRLHKVFGLGNDVGINQILSGDASFDEAVVDTEIPGVSVLPRGARSGDNIELLAGDELEALLTELEKQYSLIIIDSPPSVSLSDAVTLSRQVDAVVLVARAGVVTRSMLRHTVRRLQEVKATIAGVVLNDTKGSQLSGSYSYYYADNSYYYEEKDAPPGEAAK